MKRWVLRVSVVLCALAVLAAGSWWVWRVTVSAEQVGLALYSDDVDRARFLLRWGALGAVGSDVFPEPIIHRAVFIGDPELVEAVLQVGGAEEVNLATHGSASKTALFYLYFSDSYRRKDASAFRIEKLLLDAGARRPTAP